MKHKYVINRWKTEQNNGTACVYSSENKDQWHEKIREIMKKPEPHYCRFVVYDDQTFFSYAESESGWNAMNQVRFLMKPIQVYIGCPDYILKGG